MATETATKPRKKFDGLSQDTPKLLRFTVIATNGDKVSWLPVKAFSPSAAATLVKNAETGNRVLGVLKGHVENLL